MTNPLAPLMDDIIARIERGVPPWRQPWVNGGDPALPLRADGEPFSGANAWLLAFQGAIRGYASPWWFTFRQAIALGAAVRKGEKGSPAVLYKTRVVEEDARETAEPDTHVLRYLRGYTVFNAEQLTDCPEAYLGAPQLDRALRKAARTAVLDAVPADVSIGGDVAAYSPALDLVRIPAPEAFIDVDHFQATLAHELGHWTGHGARLDRQFGGRFGDDAYAFEELCVEIAAAALGLRIGLRPQLLDSHAAYLAHWARVLKSRPNALLEASGHASRIVDHLLSYSAGTPARVLTA